jgi:XapX domain-containing protein
MLKITILALLTGFIAGFVFALFKLPIPAPPAFPGIAGIIGIYLGYKALNWIYPFFIN